MALETNSPFRPPPAGLNEGMRRISHWALNCRRLPFARRLERLSESSEKKPLYESDSLTDSWLAGPASATALGRAAEAEVSPVYESDSWTDSWIARPAKVNEVGRAADAEVWQAPCAMVLWALGHMHLP